MGYAKGRDNLLAVIRTLSVCLILMTMFSGYLLISSKNQLKRSFVDIPAYTLGGKAESISLNTMHKTTVYSFAQLVFQNLNHWSYDGSKEYEKNIRANEHMLTPAYMAFLRRDVSRRNGNKVSSELRNRSRSMRPIATGWDEDRVKVVATREGKPSAWVVLLDIELIEKIKGETIKQLYLRYPLRVALYDIDRKSNPWMLALDGYQEEPSKISKELDNKESKNKDAIL